MDKNIEVLLSTGVSILLIIIALNSFFNYNQKLSSYYNNAIENNSTTKRVSYDGEFNMTQDVEGEVLIKTILDINNINYELIIDGINYNSLLADCNTKYEVLEKVDLTILANNVYRPKYYISSEGIIDKIVYEKL